MASVTQPIVRTQYAYSVLRRLPACPLLRPYTFTASLHSLTSRRLLVTATASSTDDEALAPNSHSLTNEADDLVQLDKSDLHSEWDSNWHSTVQYLRSSGLLDPLPNSEQLGFKYDVGDVKRALLQVARTRTDLLYAVPAEKVAALLKLEFPFNDRKVLNAARRLNATFLEGQDVPEGYGGTAVTQDLFRYIIAVGSKAQLQPEKIDQNPEVFRVVNNLMPDLVAAMAAPPNPAAVAKADAAEAAKDELARQANLSFGLAKAEREEDDYLAPSGGATGDRRQDRARFMMERGQGGGRDVQTKSGDWFCGQCNQHNFASKRDCFRCGAPKDESAREAGDGASFLPRAPRGRSSERSDRPERQDRGRAGGDFERSFQRWQPAPGEGRSDRSSERASGQPVRPGDWECPQCQAHNFSSKVVCFKCSAPRPADARAPGGGPAQAARSPRSREQQDASRYRPGDWLCGSCNAHNFATRGDCFKCGAPAAEGTPTPAPAGDTGGWERGARGRDRERAPARDMGWSRDRNNAQRTKPGDWTCSECGGSNFASRTRCFKCDAPKQGGGGPARGGGQARGGDRGYGGQQGRAAPSKQWFEGSSSSEGGRLPNEEDWFNNPDAVDPNYMRKE